MVMDYNMLLRKFRRLDIQRENARRERREVVKTNEKWGEYLKFFENPTPNTIFFCLKY